jgi:hypothetical protein
MAPPVFGAQLLLHELWQERKFWQVQTNKIETWNSNSLR